MPLPCNQPDLYPIKEDQLPKVIIKAKLPSKKKMEDFQTQSGLQPKNTQAMVQKFMDQWAQHGVESWFKWWLDAELKLSKLMAPIIGALPEEITFSSGLTENIHKLVATFYHPQGKRNKIITLQNEFSSDLYAIQSQINLKGLDDKECMISVAVNQFDSNQATQQLIEAIEKHKDELCLVWFSQVNYLTSTRIDVEQVTKICHKYDIKCLVDLAHAAGSIPLDLHKWNVDGAVMCSYKYLNSGPGCMGGLFVHKNHSNVIPGLRGWHGNSRQTQFLMRPNYEPEQDARRFQISNYDPSQAARIESSLTLFQKAGGMQHIRERNVKLSNYLIERLLDMPKLKVISPFNDEERGSHLSIIIQNTDMKEFSDRLMNQGVLGDLRKFENDVYLMRLSPAGLYITYEDCDRLLQALEYGLDNKGSVEKAKL
ncbi:kynureninase [Stylonychia lemnae]|uniref:Kynureninase n=1 Tax=Stylonychia lemnae TaxID=5949 RepID=A0A078BCQ3_STYLE|nr:kynureninase [Stylonychia lemnae]|eukprot:CDW90992.1 kynureninase [Stylonychia lemnae]